MRRGANRQPRARVSARKRASTRARYWFSRSTGFMPPPRGDKLGGQTLCFPKEKRGVCPRLKPKPGERHHVLLRKTWCLSPSLSVPFCSRRLLGLRPLALSPCRPLAQMQVADHRFQQRERHRRQRQVPPELHPPGSPAPVPARGAAAPPPVLRHNSSVSAGMASRSDSRRSGFTATISRRPPPGSVVEAGARGRMPSARVASSSESTRARKDPAPPAPRLARAPRANAGRCPRAGRGRILQPAQPPRASKMNGTKPACSGKSLARLSKAEANTITGLPPSAVRIAAGCRRPARRYPRVTASTRTAW